MYNDNFNLNESYFFQISYSLPSQITVVKNKIKIKNSKDATIDNKLNF